MTGRPAPMPTWAQLFLIPAILVALWIVGQTMGRVILVFIISVVIALLLNPLVRLLRRARIPRGAAVLLVFLGFLAALTGTVFFLIGPVRTQIEDIQGNLPLYTDQAQRQVQSLQGFFDSRGIGINVQEQADAIIRALQNWVSELADNALDYSLDVLTILVTIIFVVVASIYMILDAPRIARFAQRMGGPSAGAFLRRTERTLNQYLRAQVLVSLIIGTSAGVLLWIYGVTGIFEQGATYAVLFAAWVFVMEFIPYFGPILGAVPPVLLALFTSPITALWVIIGFLAIHQLEGHIVVPQIMSDAVNVHPLVIIFGLLVGEQLYGFVGILLAIPMVVMAKELVRFVSDRLGLVRLQAQEAELLERLPTRPSGAGPPPTAAPGPETREMPTRVVDGPTVRPEA
jgi:predicted PurR-regulated permease PerM